MGVGAGRRGGGGGRAVGGLQAKWVGGGGVVGSGSPQTEDVYLFII